GNILPDTRRSNRHQGCAHRAGCGGITMNKFLAKLRREKVERIGFKAQAQGGELELQVYDVIGADFFGEGITVGNFSDAMKEAGEYSSIKLRINSPGGDVF